MIIAALMAAALAIPPSNRCLPGAVVARLNDLIRLDHRVADYNAEHAKGIRKRVAALRAAKVAPDAGDEMLGESYANDVLKYRQEAYDVEAALHLAPKCGGR